MKESHDAFGETENPNMQFHGQPKPLDLSGDEKNPANCKLFSIKDFTLIELLTVVTVIIILFSLLLPSLYNAKMTSKRIFCMGNLKQIGIATLGYIDGYSGYCPPSHHNWTAPYIQFTIAAEMSLGGSSNWKWYADGAMAGGSVTNSIWGRCPSVGESPNIVASDRSISHYAFNYGWGAHKAAFVPSTETRKLSQFKFPSTTMMFIDAVYTPGHKAVWLVQCPICGAGSETYIQDPRHSEGSDMVLFDGHAEWQKNSYFMSNQNDVWLHDNIIQ